MKKGVLVFVVASLSILLFFSCASTRDDVFVFDDSIPIEQLTELEIFNVGGITEYNGIAVNWKSSGFGWVYVVKIPAGETQLEFNVDSRGDNTYRANGALFRYNFLPNKRYKITFRRPEKDGICGLNIYVFEIGEDTRITREEMVNNHFIAYVPFPNVLFRF